MGNGTIYQRKDGRWECRISLGKSNGKRQYRSFYGKTREEAEYKMLISQQSTDEAYAVTEMTIKELVTEWLCVQSARLKESTSANYHMKAEKHIVPNFGDIQCCLLKARDVYAFVEKKLKEGLSSRYLSDIIVLLKSVFRYANREHHIKNVLDGIIMPKQIKREVKVLSQEQQTELEQYVHHHQNTGTLGISLSMYMGLRIGEICALQWRDIDFEKRIITVRKTIQRVQCYTGGSKTRLTITEPKSDSSRREIPIPECLLSMLNKFKNENNIYVVSGTEKPVEPRTMQYRFSKVLHNANLPSVRFHSLRHLFATNCVRLGFDVKTLSEILGHSSIEITMNLYVHSDMERKRTCMQLIQKAN